MNYIKYFESDISEEILEEFFKDKIDWKFFNYLLDKITKYEDTGLKCRILIYTVRLDKFNVKEYNYIYYYCNIVDENDQTIGYNHDNTNVECYSDIEDYKKHGLFYAVTIEHDLEYIDVLIELFKDRCEIIRDADFTNQVYIILRPK